MAGYYDYVLGIIPLTLLGLTAALVVVGLELTTAVPLGAGVSGLVVGHALFVNGPAAPTETVTPPTQTSTDPADANAPLPEQA
ncbi:hypothetical protein C2R22_11385 [Salinigranum rubrum]|uniref:Uncharacterized protein n=1 Tax=Salinigranum rubrum TaxID=755307 RepID=A0A2I8VJT0_9EURY|nr:hypothetical protein [Salinigranum rubrum]AUV82176.1 hypothetical protein C2R22_11385 [Salinigranum rubrum]